VNIVLSQLVDIKGILTELVQVLLDETVIRCSLYLIFFTRLIGKKHYSDEFVVGGYKW
jgi:hypothetical protein